jgi:hypothetical protein
VKKILLLIFVISFALPVLALNKLCVYQSGQKIKNFDSFICRATKDYLFFKQKNQRGPIVNNRPFVLYSELPVQLEDGKPYLYFGAIDVEESKSQYFVDPNLTKDGTSGIIQYRWYGEPPYTTFFCKDIGE